MNIQCVLNRPNHVDRLYGTGPWAFEEVKDVPDSTASKMLRHPDVYARPIGAVSAVNAVTPVAPVVEDPLTEVYDQLQNFTKEQTLDFIKLKFNVDVDTSKVKTLSDLRAHARMLVEQFGVA